LARLACVFVQLLGSVKLALAEWAFVLDVLLFLESHCAHLYTTLEQPPGMKAAAKSATI
jgi:hypothetical protein